MFFCRKKKVRYGIKTITKLFELKYYDNWNHVNKIDWLSGQYVQSNIFQVVVYLTIMDWRGLSMDFRQHIMSSLGWQHFIELDHIEKRKILLAAFVEVH